MSQTKEAKPLKDIISINNSNLKEEFEVNTYQNTYNPLNKTFWHPNRISALGGTLSVVALGILHCDMPEYIAPATAFAGCVLDGMDGYVARKNNLRTEEGAMLDPLMDKAKMYTTGTHMLCTSIMTYASTNNMTYAALATLGAGIISNFLVDGISQKMRGDITPQLKTAYNAVVHPENCIATNNKKSGKEAVNPGKYKTAIQNVVQVAYVTGYSYSDKIASFLDTWNMEEIVNSASYSSGAVLLAAGSLGGVGIYMREKDKINTKMNHLKSNIRKNIF